MNKKLKIAMIHADLTIKGLSEKTGIKYGTIADAVRGQNMRVSSAIKIAKALNVSVEDVFSVKKEK